MAKTCNATVTRVAVVAATETEALQCGAHTVECRHYHGHCLAGRWSSEKTESERSFQKVDCTSRGLRLC